MGAKQLMQLKNKDGGEIDPPWSGLLKIGTKLQGIAALIRFANADEACFTNDQMFGIGCVIEGLADKVVATHHAIDELLVAARQFEIRNEGAIQKSRRRRRVGRLQGKMV